MFHLPRLCSRHHLGHLNTLILSCVSPSSNMATPTYIHLQGLSKALEEYKSVSSGATVDRQCYEFCHLYKRLSREESRTFLQELSPSSYVDKSQVRLNASRLLEAQTEAKFEKLQADLKTSLQPPINRLFSKIGQTRGGVKFLVDLRKDIISTLGTLDPGSQDYKNLQELSKNLKSLLTVWISVGFMSLSRVTWDSPSSLLEKISDYEAVHPLRSWTDLKSRVGPYRRVFVYTHPCMVGEPLVVLHVALTKQVSGCMRSVLKEFRSVNQFNKDNTDSPVFLQSEEDIGSVDTAIFYSITSTQEGLKGIELGTHLIKQAVLELRRELPGLARFSTLSPIPGFRSWVLMELTRSMKEQAQTPLLPPEAQALESLHEGRTSSEEILYELVKTGSWVGDQTKVTLLKPILLRLCTRYLYLEKRRNKALDPVANFHIRNGAVLYRVNWLADPSPRGMSNSCGIMVNYRYYIEELEANSTEYLTNNKLLADPQVLSFLDPPTL